MQDRLERRFGINEFESLATNTVEHVNYPLRNLELHFEYV